MKIYPEHTAIKTLCELEILKEWYNPNTITGLKRPHEHDQIPWYTDSVAATTSSGPSTYDATELRINEHEPVLVFFSNVRNGRKLKGNLSGLEKDASCQSHEARCWHVHENLSWSLHQRKVRDNRKATADLGAFRKDDLSQTHEAPNFPCIHVNENLAISFHRTIRIPDGGGSYPTPNSLGALPVLSVAQLKDKLPRDSVEKGGLIIPLYSKSSRTWHSKFEVS